MLTVGSTFTGVGGADLGLERAGYQIKWQCELDAWKRSILAAHWPNVPIYDDITTLTDPEPVDMMIGGFPCQDLSVAGKRKGFDGDRSVLAFEFLRVAESLQPRWLVLENVLGWLSSNKGLDFRRLLNEVVACGYGVGWRCLDARYFGVAQRRRRIFLVARRAEVGVDSRAASELALRALCESGDGDTTPSWEPWQETTAVAGIGAQSGGGGDISPAVTAKWKKGTGGPAGDECQNLVTFYPTGGSHNSFARTDGVSPTLKRGSGVGAESGTAIAYRKSKRAQTEHDDETWVADGGANTLNKFDIGDSRATHAVVQQAATSYTSTVRRLSPLECERLMAWPDGWTAPEGIKAPDTKRYAACGDGIVASVAYWIGQRINMIEGVRA